MRLTNCSFKHQIYLPNGGGGTADFVREPAHLIELEGNFVLVRNANVLKGQLTTKVPLSNVASFVEHVEPKLTSDPKALPAKA